MKLIPPDLEQCQAYPNMLSRNFIRFDPTLEPIQCENKPVWIAKEIKPGKDRQCGSMSLCQNCMKLMSQSLQNSVQFNLINF